MKAERKDDNEAFVRSVIMTADRGNNGMFTMVEEKEMTCVLVMIVCRKDIF